MRLKLDENLPADLAVDLRERGHDVETVVEEDLGGRADRLVLAAARRERRTLITLDKGILEHAPRGSGPAAPPIIVIRLRSSGAKAARAASIRAVEELEATGPFTTAVVTEVSIRLRR